MGVITANEIEINGVAALNERLRTRPMPSFQCAERTGSSSWISRNISIFANANSKALCARRGRMWQRGGPCASPPRHTSSA